MYREYQQREDAIREETTKFNRVKREAKSEEKIQNAINGLRKGYSLEIIADITELSIEEIEAIKVKLNI